MSDLVKRLRSFGGTQLAIDAMREAATTIEQQAAEIASFRAELALEKRANDEAIVALDKVRAEKVKLVEALTQLVKDYEDVPDQSDSDGQAVFERARAALASATNPFAKSPEPAPSQEELERMLRMWGERWDAALASVTEPKGELKR